MRRLKTIITVVFGFTLLALGAAMVILPGPGLVTIALGLLVLSSEFVWAKRALDRMKDEAQRARDRWGPSRPAQPPAGTIGDDMTASDASGLEGAEEPGDPGRRRDLDCGGPSPKRRVAP
jgi:hypothetical protein